MHKKNLGDDRLVFDIIVERTRRNQKSVRRQTDNRNSRATREFSEKLSRRRRNGSSVSTPDYIKRSRSTLTSRAARVGQRNSRNGRSEEDFVKALSIASTHSYVIVIRPGACLIAKGARNSQGGARAKGKARSQSRQIR